MRCTHAIWSASLESSYRGRCDDTANKLACVPQVMQRLNVSTDDYIIVGSAVLQDAVVRLATDILVRPSVQGRISHCRALKLSPSVQMISINWLVDGGVSDRRC